MITPLDSRVMDVNSEALGVSVKTLMGNAGRAVADFIRDNYHGRRIAFFCGHGNNGGDGFAAASLLKDENISIHLLSPREKITSGTVLEYLESTGITPVEGAEIPLGTEVLVDCGLGTGLSGRLRPEYEAYVRNVNSFKGVKISVDVPTGFGTESSVLPDHCIALHDIKTGMNESNCGNIIVADIGMPAEATDHTGPGDMLRYPIPAENSHKGSNGSLLIIGGGPYVGAPAMSGMAALRVGTDLVTILTPGSSYHEIASFNPVLMVRSLGDCDHIMPEHLDILLEQAGNCRAVLIGPGLGKNPDTVKTVRMFLSRCTVPVVVDADGINSLGTHFTFTQPAIITPHSKEYERVGGEVRNLEGVRELAARMHCTVVLKGRDDLISDGHSTRINSTGCSAMTGAGTGDVLSGIVAGLLSKGMSLFDSACLGAYISGKAGEDAFEHKSYGLIATDVIDSIPNILRTGLPGRMPR